jgi:hypothetical protein
MSSAPFDSIQFTTYNYNYYGRQVYVQELVRNLSVALLTTFISAGDTQQRCHVLGSSARGETIICHEFIPSHFGSCPDVLFIVCPEPCTLLCHEDLVTFSSPYPSRFTTTQPPYYGTILIPLPSVVDEPAINPRPEPATYPD